ncbi:MAG: type II toxin-antitoxin system RelE/ParE family toxin [Nitrospinae bacterium]|nr:type II toxin-antitoxin system RelE/ParE family toxin [Nitrospinota bacterium]
MALKTFEPNTLPKIKEALRHLAQHPLEGKPPKGFKKDTVWSYRGWPYRILYRLIGTE